jgi:catechol 2,3-dioxygenase-like lactoylglutathione lyase family enzyme
VTATPEHRSAAEPDHAATSASLWSVRSILISVRDLDRSVAFYTDVMGVHELVRQDQVAILAFHESRSFALMLREAPGQATRHGQQETGVRALSFDVKDAAAMDRVQGRLERHGLLRGRRRLAGEPFEVVEGHDPDGLPLLFIAYGTAPLPPDHYRQVAPIMYSLDV